MAECLTSSEHVVQFSRGVQPCPVIFKPRFIILLCEYGSVTFYVVLHKFCGFPENSHGGIIFLKKKKNFTRAGRHLRFTLLSVQSLCSLQSCHKQSMNLHTCLKWLVFYNGQCHGRISFYKTPLCLHSWWL